MKLYHIIIALVIGFVIGFFLNKSKTITNEVTKTVIDTVYSTEIDTIHITKWKVKERILPNDTIFIHFDSTKLVEIAKQYYAINNYDTTLQGPECTLNFKATIYQNEFLKTKFILENNRPTQINKTDITQYSNKWSAGAQIQGNLNSLDVFRVIGYKQKKTSHSALYSPISKTVGFGVKIDI